MIFFFFLLMDVHACKKNVDTNWQQSSVIGFSLKILVPNPTVNIALKIIGEFKYEHIANSQDINIIVFYHILIINSAKSIPQPPNENKSKSLLGQVIQTHHYNIWYWLYKRHLEQ